MFIWIVFKWKWNGNIVIIIISNETNSFNLFHVSLIDQSFLILRYKERNLKYVIPYYLAEIFLDEVVSQRFKNIKNIMIALTKK